MTLARIHCFTPRIPDFPVFILPSNSGALLHLTANRLQLELTFCRMPVPFGVPAFRS
jgi:hypothetical protein